MLKTHWLLLWFIFKSIFPSLKELLICSRSSRWDQCASWLTWAWRYWRGLLGPGRESLCLGCCPQAAAMLLLLLSKANYHSRKLEVPLPHFFHTTQHFAFWKTSGSVSPQNKWGSHSRTSSIWWGRWPKPAGTSSGGCSHPCCFLARLQ